jgi:phage tail sheath protein FI
MIAWYGNRLVRTWFQKVDKPMNRRLMETIVESEGIGLNALVAAGALLGGEIKLDPEANNLLSLMDGQIVFLVSLGLVSPAQSIHFRLQYEPSYLESLFA